MNKKIQKIRDLLATNNPFATQQVVDMFNCWNDSGLMAKEIKPEVHRTDPDFQIILNYAKEHLAESRWPKLMHVNPYSIPDGPIQNPAIELCNRFNLTSILNRKERFNGTPRTP